MFDNEALIKQISGNMETTITPTRYKGDGTGDSKDYSKNNCLDDIDYTDGQILFHGSQMSNQISCNPFIGNGGNWYSWPAATAGGYHETSGFNESNSVCPRGWQLTINTASDPKSWQYLILTTYNIQDSNDNRIRLLPMSFVRSGSYNQGSLNFRAIYGNYWSSAALNSDYAYSLDFSTSNLKPQYTSNKNRGNSVRCVSR